MIGQAGFECQVRHSNAEDVSDVLEEIVGVGRKPAANFTLQSDMDHLGMRHPQLGITAIGGRNTGTPRNPVERLPA